jgi:serine/threonine-protein kinase
MSSPKPTPVVGTDGALQPFFSPDGQWLGFFQDGKLKKMALAGGTVATIADVVQFQGGSWGADGNIVYASRGRLFRVGASGGTPELLAEPDSAREGRLPAAYRWPELLPNGRTVVFTLVRGPSDPVLATLSLTDRKVTELDQPGMSPRYVEGGTLVFAQNDSTLFAAPFGAGQARFTGPPQPLVEGIRLGPASVAKASVSRSGAIAYLEGSAGAGRELVLTDEGGRLEVLPLQPQRYEGPAFSPDGRQLVFAVSLSGSPFVSDLWSWDVGRRIMTRLTFDTASGGARWTPDGRRIVYGRRMSPTQAGIFWMVPDGSGAGDTLLAREGINVGGRVTPDGRRMVFMVREGGTTPPSANWNIWITPVDSPAAARPLLNNRFNEGSPEISPDGRWLAYVTNETGDNVVYVRRLEGGGRQRVSSGGGFAPQWSTQGRELFYRNGDSVYVVPVTNGTELGLGAPRVRFVLPSQAVDFDIHPDGHHVVFVRQPTAESQTIQVILNRFARRP